MGDELGHYVCIAWLRWLEDNQHSIYLMSQKECQITLRELSIMPSWASKSLESYQVQCKEASENKTSLDDFGILILGFRGLCLVVLVAPTLISRMMSCLRVACRYLQIFERVMAVH